MNLIEKVQPLLIVYPELRKQYQSFISQADDKIKSINGVEILDSDPDSLKMEALGFEFIIQFKMRINQKNAFLGEITAFLITENIDLSLSKTPLYSIWTDKLGNVKKELEASTSFYSIRDDNLLSDFVYNVLDIIGTSKMRV